MSSDRIYRRLLFIRFLHGFFLDADDGSVPDSGRYFTATEDEVNRRLRANVVNGQYTLMDDLLIQPSEQTQRILDGHRLIYKILPHGLLVGTAVREETINGAIKLKPVIPIDTGLRLQFYIGARNAFSIYSSTRLDPVIPASYYFTNDNKNGGVKYPSLSVPIKNFIDGRFYQMGDLAIINGTLQQAILPAKNVLPWRNIDLKNVQYVSEYDRMLINKKFTYTFDSNGIKEATFELQQNGRPVKTITFSSDDLLSQVSLDFEKKIDKTLIADGRYQLKVTGSDNYIWESEVYLNNSLYSHGRWGVIDIAMHTEDPELTILDEKGYLINNDKSPYPTLDLRMLNRSTYWKYYFQQKGPIENDEKWTPSSLPTPPGVDKVILSKVPLALMKSLRKVKYADNYLPNPSEQRLGKEDDKKQGTKICSEILLTKIKL